MARFRENLGVKSEVVGGRVPLSEIDTWMEVLDESPNRFTDAEKQEFLKKHLVTKITDCVDRGMTENETVKEVVRELSSGQSKPNDEIIVYVKMAVAATFDKINN